MHGNYVQAVEGQIQPVVESGWVEDRQVATIFFGGGTPSILAPELLAGLLRQFQKHFSMIEEEVETSIEVNPATVNYSDLVQLNQAGFNRISIGVQSLSDGELLEIGRPHTAADAIQTIADARKAEFSHLNVDLMYGLPGQTVNSWTQTIQRALQEEPDHLAIYELTIEDGTPIAFQKQQGNLNLPSEDEVLEMMGVTEEMVSKAGLLRYEISNYARPGSECRHNINYWQNGWYVGLGPGAVSCLGGRRYTGVADIDEYYRRIISGEDWWSDMEELDREARFRETVVMGLRMMDGISREGLVRRFGLDIFDYYKEIWRHLEQQRLVDVQGDRFRLTHVGMNFANQVMALLV